jgi:hypothetical protein
MLIAILALSLAIGRGQTSAFPYEPVAPSPTPAVLPGNGLARHDFFYAGEAKTRDMYIVRWKSRLGLPRSFRQGRNQ